MRTITPYREKLMNKKTYGYFLITTMPLLVVAGCAATKEASRALLDWEAGTVYSYEVTQERTQVIEMPGQGAQENTSTIVTDMSVTATGPYQFTINVTDVEATGSQISVEPLKGLESAVVTGTKGKIISATGLSDNAYINERGGEEIFVEEFQLLFQILPDEPLAPGVSWTRETSISFSQQGLNLKRDMSEEYSCKELTTFNGTSAFELELTSEVEIFGTGSQGGQEMELTLNGTFQGTVYLDAITGALLSSEQSGSMAGVIDMPAASLPMSMDLSISAKIAE